MTREGGRSRQCSCSVHNSFSRACVPDTHVCHDEFVEAGMKAIPVVVPLGDVAALLVRLKVRPVLGLRITSHRVITRRPATSGRVCSQGSQVQTLQVREPLQQ